MDFMKQTLYVAGIFVFLIFTGMGAAGYGLAAPQEGNAATSPPVAGSLDEHFQKAKQYLEKQDYNKAAAEIRQAGVLLDKEAGTAAEDAGKSLAAARERLEQLADQVDKGAVKSVDDMRSAFAQAHQALAEEYREKASQSWTEKAAARFSQEIEIAADNIESAWDWSGKQIQEGSRSAVAYAKEIGNKLARTGKGVSADVTQALERLGTEIKMLNRDQPDKPIAIQTDQKPARVTEIRDVLTTAITDVADATIPAVAHIEIIERREVPNPFFPYEDNPMFRKFFHLPKHMPKKFEQELRALGSGMIIDPKGFILTNNHVVAGATQIKVLLSDGAEFPAEVVGLDPKTDLAVIKISADKPLPHVVFGDSDQMKVGQWVVAIGHPSGLDQTVTQGIISAKHRTGILDPSDYQDFLQTDAPINPGNSGGPLLNLRGEVIGVNSAIASESGGFEGLGFAIPSKMAVYIANALIAHGKVERGWLGANIQELTPALAKSFGISRNKGALIADVLKESPAHDAGMKRGDVVLEYNGAPVNSAGDLRNKVFETPIGTEVKITVWRNEEKKELTVRIGNLEDLRKRLAEVVKSRLGIVVGPVTMKEAENYGMEEPVGVTIQWLDPKGPFALSGLEVGDLILAIEGTPVEGVLHFLNTVKDLPHHKQIVVGALDHRSGRTGMVKVDVN